MFPLFIGFVCSVIVVFCRCVCTCLRSLCWRRCLLSDVLSPSRFLVVVVFSSRDKFSRRSPEEFRWKIFASKDFQPLVVLDYSVTLIPCYLVTPLPCYLATLLLCYLGTLIVTLLPCYLVTLIPCYSVTLLPCYPVTLLCCYSVHFYCVTLLLCYLEVWSSLIHKEIAFRKLNCVFTLQKLK